MSTLKTENKLTVKNSLAESVAQVISSIDTKSDTDEPRTMRRVAIVKSAELKTKAYDDGTEYSTLEMDYQYQDKKNDWRRRRASLDYPEGKMLIKYIQQESELGNSAFQDGSKYIFTSTRIGDRWSWTNVEACDFKGSR